MFLYLMVLVNFLYLKTYRSFSDLMGIEKVILGLILVIVGLWLVLPISWCPWCIGWWQEFWAVIKGILPMFLIFIGAILVWIESEELKVQKPKRKR